jgi:hypothetical protein
MKKIDLSKAPLSSASKITSAISKKLKENEDKTKSKIDLGKLAEKLADRKARAEEDNSDGKDE